MECVLTIVSMILKLMVKKPEERQRRAGWIFFKGCIRIAASKHALQYIAFKVPHTYDDLKNYMSEDTLSQVLFMPVIQPGRQDYLDFTDSWISHGNERVIAYETNFKPSTDQALKPITREGKAYQNFLHYVYARTGLRPDAIRKNLWDLKV